MKSKYKTLGILVMLIASPLLVGLFLPKEKIVTEKAFIDKMYFFILADITNHWEEPAWRNNLDTMVQVDQIDGMDAWKEYYTNGDSVLLMTQVTAATDYIRIIVDNDGKERMRSIMLVDVQGKTAIRMSEEIIENNPIKRFIGLFNDNTQEDLQLYLTNLVEKNKPQEQEDSDDTW